MDWLAVGGRRASRCPCRPVSSIRLIIGSPPWSCPVSPVIDFAPVASASSSVARPLFVFAYHYPSRLVVPFPLYAGRDGMVADCLMSMS